MTAVPGQVTRSGCLGTDVLRGGAWNNTPDNVRVANRNRNEPANRNDNNGFRAAASIPRRGDSIAHRNDVCRDVSGNASPRHNHTKTTLRSNRHPLIVVGRVMMGDGCACGVGSWLASAG